MAAPFALIAQGLGAAQSGGSNQGYAGGIGYRIGGGSADPVGFFSNVNAARLNRKDERAIEEEKRRQFEVAMEEQKRQFNINAAMQGREQDLSGLGALANLRNQAYGNARGRSFRNTFLNAL